MRVPIDMMEKFITAFLSTLLITAAVRADDVTTQQSAAFKSVVRPFFQAHCFKCHGP